MKCMHNSPRVHKGGPLAPIAKGIVVDGDGKLDLFGKLYYQSWTRLAASNSTREPITIYS